MVAIRLPNAGPTGHGAAVHGEVLAADTGGAGREGHAAPAAVRGFGLRGFASAGEVPALAENL